MNEPRPPIASETEIAPHERSVFRRVFLARVQGGAWVEAAEKQAMEAVKIWRRLGLFEERRAEESTLARCMREVAAAADSAEGLDRERALTLVRRYPNEFDFLEALLLLVRDEIASGSVEDPLAETTIDSVPNEIEGYDPVVDPLAANVGTRSIEFTRAGVYVNGQRLPDTMLPSDEFTRDGVYVNGQRLPNTTPVLVKNVNSEG